MFWKLLLIILAAGVIAAALLVNRQHRIDAAHEIAGMHHRLTSKEQTLWKLEMEISRRLRPEDVREQLQQMGGEWVALPAPPRKRRKLEPTDDLQLAERKHEEHSKSDFGG